MHEGNYWLFRFTQASILMMCHVPQVRLDIIVIVYGCIKQEKMHEEIYWLFRFTQASISMMCHVPQARLDIIVIGYGRIKQDFPSLLSEKIRTKSHEFNGHNG